MDDAKPPAALLAQFDGTGLEGKLAVAAVLATVADDGWPHVAYLSAGEILVVGEDRLRVQLWPGSGSAANLRRGGGAVLHAAAEGAVWELRLDPVATIDTPDCLILDLAIGRVFTHRAPYADVLGMIGFALKDEAGTLQRWEAQIAHLRSIGGTAPASAPVASQAR